MQIYSKKQAGKEDQNLPTTGKKMSEKSGYGADRNCDQIL